MKTHKVRPILIKNKDFSSIKLGDLITNEKGSLQLLKSDSLLKTIQLLEKDNLQESKSYQLILISLKDEKIEVGDKFYDEEDNSIEVSFGLLSGLISIKDNSYIGCNPSLCKKVIATQDQLSLELIKQLVDEYNNGGMKDFEIEMECIYGRPVINGTQSFKGIRPKLTDNFIIPIKKETILYTEEEVKNIFFWLGSKDYLSDNYEEIFTEWFEQNKKK